MAKYPSEIFGWELRNLTPEAEEMRNKYWCPFHGSQCFKQSRLIDYPFGVCTAHVDGQEIALCPRRFLEKNKVFQDIATFHFGTKQQYPRFSRGWVAGYRKF